MPRAYRRGFASLADRSYIFVTMNGPHASGYFEIRDGRPVILLSPGKFCVLDIVRTAAVRWSTDIRRHITFNPMSESGHKGVLAFCVRILVPFEQVGCVSLVVSADQAIIVVLTRPPFAPESWRTNLSVGNPH